MSLRLFSFTTTTSNSWSASPCQYLNWKLWLPFGFTILFDTSRNSDSFVCLKSFWKVPFMPHWLPFGAKVGVIVSTASSTKSNRCVFQLSFLTSRSNAVSLSFSFFFRCLSHWSSIIVRISGHFSSRDFSCAPQSVSSALVTLLITIRNTWRMMSPRKASQVTQAWTTPPRMKTSFPLPEISGHGVILLRICFRKLPASNVWRTFRRSISLGASTRQALGVLSSNSKCVVQHLC